MIVALAPLSIRWFTYLEILCISFYETLIFFESFLRILSSGINLPKVIGTKFSCVDDLNLLLFWLEFCWLTRQERNDS